MRIPTSAIAVIAVVICPAFCQLQSPVRSEEKPKLARTFRPKLSLEDALKNAEKFVITQNVDMSRFWLYRAQFILFGDSSQPDTKKVPGWHFWWVSDSGGLGDYVEVFVSMDGDCRRLPSM